jgi:hypothetical protein
MGTIIGASICLDQIDESKVTIAQNGKRYLNISIVVNDKLDKYGKHVELSHSQTKEERDSKAKKKYLGSGNQIWPKVNLESWDNSQPVQPVQIAVAKNDNDLPF